jgi:hypothetical protein
MSEKLLTIGMATYDDFDGVYFSVQALIEYHLKDLRDKVEILIIDNNPKSKHGEEVCKFARLSKCRYIPFENKTGTSIRNEIFRNAKGEYTVCMDCHVLFKENAIRDLLKFFEENPDSKDLIQGPLWNDDHVNLSTHMREVWLNDFYGYWQCDKESYLKAEPFEIKMMGLGLFACKTSEWLGFNEKFKSFGGEEMYIHEKYRINGRKCLCLPSFGWFHRFARPNGIFYPRSIHDRIYNYFIGWLELYKDENHPLILGTIDNFKKSISEEKILDILNQAKNEF